MFSQELKNAVLKMLSVCDMEADEIRWRGSCYGVDLRSDKVNLPKLIKEMVDEGLIRIVGANRRYFDAGVICRPVYGKA